LLTIHKRIANKRRCPCGSGNRAGRCHNKKLNLWRTRLGRRFCKGVLNELLMQLAAGR
jgi:hypothetical protein